MLILSTIIYLFLALGAGFYLLIAEIDSARRLFVAICWVPLGLLVYVWVYESFLKRVLGYEIMAVGVGVAGSSLVLGLFGFLLLLRAWRDKVRRTAILICSVLAIAPILVMVCQAYYIASYDH